MSFKIKEIGSGVLGLFGVVAMFVITAALLFGAMAFSLWMLQWAPIAFKIAFAVSVLVLCPAAFISPTRGFAAFGFMAASYGFGTILWVSGMAFTYITWGLFAVIIGLVILGIGVVPIAMLAALIHGDWGDLVGFIFLGVLTYGSRILAMWLGHKADELTERLAVTRS